MKKSLHFAAILLLEIVAKCFHLEGQTVNPVHNAQQVAELTIHVCSTFGESISPVTTFLRNVESSERIRNIGSNLAYHNVKFGTYELTVEAPGFSVRREWLSIHQPKLAFRIGLFPSIGHRTDRPHLEFTIKNSTVNKNLWTRLVPLYSNTFLEQEVNSLGAFGFSNLDPGRYVLLIFDNNQLLLTKQLDYFGEQMKLEIELP